MMIFQPQNIQDILELIRDSVIDVTVNDIENSYPDLVSHMIELGLLKSDRGRIIFGAKAHDIMLAGGWIEYNRKLEIEKAKRSKIEKRRFRIPLFISAGAVLVAAYVAFFKTDKSIEKAIEPILTWQDSSKKQMLLLNNQIQKIQPPIIQIDSLKRRVDSLEAHEKHP